MIRVIETRRTIHQRAQLSLALAREATPRRAAPSVAGRRPQGFFLTWAGCTWSSRGRCSSRWSRCRFVKVAPIRVVVAVLDVVPAGAGVLSVVWWCTAGSKAAARAKSFSFITNHNLRRPNGARCPAHCSCMAGSLRGSAWSPCPTVVLRRRWWRCLCMGVGFGFGVSIESPICTLVQLHVSISAARVHCLQS